MVAFISFPFAYFVFVGVVQGMITGIRGLCNGIGPALFGLIFFVFHVDLEDENGTSFDFHPSTNQTNMEDPYGKVLIICRVFIHDGSKICLVCLVKS